jgi:hypothetical protein
VCSFDLLRGKNLVHFKFQVFIKLCIEGEFCLCLHDLPFYTSCIFLSFDHKYFCVSDTFIPVLHMFDVFCEVFQESWRRFVILGQKGGVNMGR